MLRRPLRAALVLVPLLVLPACSHLHWPWHRTEKAKAPAPIDLNRASLSKIEALPGITPSMAKKIVDGRPYEDLVDLVHRDILTRRELQRIEDRVKIERPSD